MSSSNSAATSIASDCNNNEEEETSTSSVLLTATPKDVVGGRGKNTRLHPGNLFYSKLLKESYEEYKDAPKGSKVDICKKIIAMVAEQGGRFLEKASSSSSSSSDYVELGEDRAIAKIAQGFRDLRVVKEGSRSHARKVIQAHKSAAVAAAKVGRPGKEARTSVGVASAKSPVKGNGAVPGQPRRLSFTERVKLFQKEQEKLTRRQNGDEVTSSEEEEESEEDEDDFENEVQEQSSDDEDDDDNSKPSSAKQPAYGDAGDVSETETEDSFPTYQKDDKKSGDSKDEEESDNENL
jgi:hypothetical protein